MKSHYLLTAVLAVLSPLFVLAQNHSIGPEIGVNFASLSDAGNGESQPGLNLGLIYNYSSDENLGFGLGAFYSQEGYQISDAADSYTRLNYLRIPVKVQYFFRELGDNFRPKVYAGPSVGFLLGGEYKADTGSLEVEGDIDMDDFKTAELGIMLGTGFNYQIQEATWLNFDLSYTHGLTDITEAAEENRNRNLRLGLGVAWGF